MAEDDWDTTDRMVFVGYSKESFRCSCGGNVFRQNKHDPLKYKCNSCGAKFIGQEGKTRAGVQDS